MNHDETNSNPNREMRTWIEPELEARVVAWVAGEASAFEIAELERLVAEKPELAVFKRRIEAVHGLVAEAALPDKVPVRLSGERRAKLLAAIGATPEVTAAGEPRPIVAMAVSKKQPWWTRRAPQIYFALSGVAAAGLIALFIAPDRFTAHKEAAAIKASVAIQGELKDRESQGARSPDTRPPASAEAPDFARPELSRSRGSNQIGADAPQRVEPNAAAIRQAAATQSGMEDQAARAGNIIAEPAPIKLDAFVVSDSSDRGYASLASTAPTLSNNLSILTKSELTLGDAAAVAPIDGFARFGDAATAGEKTVPNAQLQFVTGSTMAADNKTPPGASGSAFGFGRHVGSVTLGASGQVTDVDGQNRNSPPAENRIVFGEQLADLSAPKSVASSDAPSLTLGQSAVVGGSIGPVQTKEAGLTISAFEVRAPTRKDADDVAEQEASRTAAEASAAVATTVNGISNSNLALNEARKKLASATERLNKLREERAAMLNVAKQPREAPAKAKEPAPAAAADEMDATREAVSTFSLHVSDVSFRLAVAAVAALGRGENLKMPAVRAEEFYNAFDYGDPAPTVAEKVGARIEQSAHPVLQGRNLLRIAMKVPATGRGAGQPLRLTVLLDTSGSMEREDRRLAVRRALEELIALLGPNDRVTLIGFARQPRLLAEAVPGDKASHLVELSARTPAEGGTNLEQALKIAGELAIRHQLPAAQNRIVLLTDGAANLGNADPAQLAVAVETLRQHGIAFDACGIGLEGIGDNVLEALTRKGDGRYYVVDRPEAADAAFARQLAGAFRPAAENVKLQVRFNPARVGNYRLIGFEQHRLREEDFRNDKVDAAELAAEEAATALYQVEVKPEGSGEIGEVYVRFRDATTGAMVERSWTIRYDPQAPQFDRATPSLQLAGMAALVAEKLSDSPLAHHFKLGDFAAVVNTLRGHYANDARVQELVTMYSQLRRIGRE